MTPQTQNTLITAGTKILTIGATSLAAHGIINSNSIETVVSLGLLVASISSTIWDQYLKVIIISQLEVLKAKSVAQAEAMRKANIPSVTATQIANKGPDNITPDVVRKVMATLPIETHL